MSTAIWVEPIPPHLRTGHLAGHRWGALLRVDNDPPVAVFVPTTPVEQAMTPEQFGARKAAEWQVDLVPLPEGMAWLPASGDWVLMEEQEGRATPDAPLRPAPGSAPGIYWPDVELDRAAVAS